MLRTPWTRVRSITNSSKKYMATFRTTGEVKSLPKRNTWGQFQYRVAVDKEFAEAINKVWGAATQATPKQCLNTTAPAWLNEEAGVWTVTVGTGKAGMYPAGVSYGKECKISFRIGKDKYTQIIASAVDEVAAALAAIAVERMEAVREAVQEREFDEQITGISAKLKSMAVLAGELSVPLGDLMAADKIIKEEKEREKKALSKKGSSLRSAGTKTKTDVVLSEKIIAKWVELDEAGLQEAMETYAEITDVDLTDVIEAWDLATAEQN